MTFARPRRSTERRYAFAPAPLPGSVLERLNCALIHLRTLSPVRMRTLDLPRDLRTRAGREAPADGALEVPRRARRRRGARRIAGDHRGRPAIDRDLDARRLRVVHVGGADRSEPDLTRGARPQALLLQLQP